MAQFPLSDIEVRLIIDRGELRDREYDILYSYYANNGEMPYGTAKARDGDPYQWMMNQLEER